MASAAEEKPELYSSTDKSDVERHGSVARTEKGRWERLWPVIACGAGLFSDGYLNNVGHSNATLLPKRHDTLKSVKLDIPIATSHAESD